MPKETKIYHYHPDTKELLGQGVARLDPLEGKPLIPAHATTTPVPSKKLSKNQAYLFERGEWIIVPDYRNEKFYDDERNLIEITEIGQEPNDKWHTEKPPPPPLTKPEIMVGIKAEAGNRIAESGHDWMAMRAITANEPVPQEIVDYAQEVRSASNSLEQAAPQDFMDDKYWPDRL